MKYTPVKLYRRFRYRKGHGVHSPFAYNFITGIIEEKSPYYIFEDIEKLRSELLEDNTIVEFISPKGVVKRKTVAEITAKEAHSDKYGALLFRIVNFFQSKSILQIGASTGIMTLYMAAPCKDCQCYVIEDRKALIPIIKASCQKFNQSNVHIISGEYMESLTNLQNEKECFDMVFLNTSRNPELTQQILDKQIKTRLLVVDNIRKNKKMKAVWQTITSNPQARITIDLYYLGIALFENKFYKKNYKAHFDNGTGTQEKQNLYKNRRQRLNFFSWRKKDR